MFSQFLSASLLLLFLRFRLMTAILAPFPKAAPTIKKVKRVVEQNRNETVQTKKYGEPSTWKCFNFLITHIKTALTEATYHLLPFCLHNHERVYNTKKETDVCKTPKLQRCNYSKWKPRLTVCCKQKKKVVMDDMGARLRKRNRTSCVIRHLISCV